jgi:hypothetical protein
MKTALVLLFGVIFSFAAFGHSGGLDANGGHNNRKAGTYHCHRATCMAQAVQSTIPIAKQASSAYDRNSWKHWSDFDSDCMNTRHEMLLAQADGKVKLSPDGCYVSTGYWLDPFSGKSFTRASDLDVDHIVPLKWAHDHGGAAWSSEEKEDFANDPLNLLVVDDGLNQSKGAKGADEWLPPNHSFRCVYLGQWSEILTKYDGLSMNSSEARIFNKQLNACN